MTPTIKRGATVRLTTTNGGDTIAVLAANYVETYDAVLDQKTLDGTGSFRFIVPAYRIKTIEEVTLQ